LQTSAFLFEQEALMHAHCWPPLARLLEQGRQTAREIAGRADRTADPKNCPYCNKDTLRHHTHSDGDRRWVTARCTDCGWVDTTSWIEKRPSLKEQRGSRGQD
jgi:transposase-like protein